MSLMLYLACDATGLPISIRPLILRSGRQVIPNERLRVKRLDLRTSDPLMALDKGRHGKRDASKDGIKEISSTLDLSAVSFLLLPSWHPAQTMSLLESVFLILNTPLAGGGCTM